MGSFDEFRQSSVSMAYQICQTVPLATQHQKYFPLPLHLATASLISVGLSDSSRKIAPSTEHSPQNYNKSHLVAKAKGVWSKPGYAPPFFDITGVDAARRMTKCCHAPWETKRGYKKGELTWGS